MNEDINHLVEVINENINYFRQEYKLSYAETIGALEIIKMDLFNEAKEN